MLYGLMLAPINLSKVTVLVISEDSDHNLDILIPI